MTLFDEDANSILVGNAVCEIVADAAEYNDNDRSRFVSYAIATQGIESLDFIEV